MIPVEFVRSALEYNPFTGELFWLPRNDRRFDMRFAGREAFTTVNKGGYKIGGIFGKTFLAHRVCWAIHTGEWPDQTDHENGIKTDNRFLNLRDTSVSGNMKNTVLQKNNTSGVPGVYFRKDRGKWAATIKSNGQAISLGLYVDKNAAIAIRKQAERKYGFHENHGRILNA